MLRQPWAGWVSRWASSALWAMMTLPTKCWTFSEVIPPTAGSPFSINALRFAWYLLEDTRGLLLLLIYLA